MLNSLRVRLALLFMLAVFLPMGLLSWVAWQMADQTFEAELGQRLGSAAAMGAAAFHSQRPQAWVVGGPSAQEAGRLLGRMAQSAGAESLQMLSPQGLLLASSSKEAALGSRPAFLDLDPAEYRQALQGRVCAAPLFVGPSGRLYKSAYAPLQQEGSVIAVIRAEAGAAYFDRLRQWAWGLAMAMAMVLMLALALAVLAARPWVIPLQELSRAAERVSQGDLKTRVQPRGPLEIAALAQGFNMMSARIEEQLAQQQRLATLGELSAGMAHEIRNPLAAIEGFSTLLFDALPKGDARRGLASDIRAEVRQMNDVLTDFLSYARPPEPRLEAVALQAVLKASWAMALPGPRYRHYALAPAPRRALKAWADPVQLKQVFINLLLNARDAMPEGGPIEVGWGLEDGGVLIWVQDSGQGIDEESLLKIFQPFHTTKPQGTGLGLAVSERMIRNMQGQVRALHAKDGGLRLEIRLPSAR
jgi:signal transduction histidine kinase